MSIGIIIKGAKIAGGAIVSFMGAKELAQLGMKMAEQGVAVAVKIYENKLKEQAELINAPELFAEDYHLKLDEAICLIEEIGLKAIPVVPQANIKYKDCSDMEVVATNYRLKQKLKPGSHIVLKYVTKEVIEASQNLFEESERKKAEAEQIKINRKIETEQKKIRQKAKAEQKKIEQKAEMIQKKIDKDLELKQKLNERLVHIKRGLNTNINNIQNKPEGIVVELIEKNSEK